VVFQSIQVVIRGSIINKNYFKVPKCLRKKTSQTTRQVSGAVPGYDDDGGKRQIIHREINIAKLAFGRLLQQQVVLP
jgi:hypothetical protein